MKPWLWTFTFYSHKCLALSSPCLCSCYSLWIEHPLHLTQHPGSPSPNPTHHMAQFKGPSSMKPFLSSSAESNLSLIKSCYTICTSLKALPFLHGTIFIYVHKWFLWNPKNRCSSKISAGSPSLVRLHLHTHIHMYPSTRTISSPLHSLLPLLTWLQCLYSNLLSYGSLKFSPSFLTAC